MINLYKITKSLFFLLIFSFIFIFPFLNVNAEEISSYKTEIIKAKILKVENQNTTNIPELDIPQIQQNITAKILEGEFKNKTITFLNDYIELKENQTVYLNHNTDANLGIESFSVQDVYRLPVLYFFIILFIVLVLLIGGVQGLRGLISLAGSFLLIMYVLIPGILQGFSPMLVSIGVASLIIILGSYITHGFNKTTSSAVLGMIITVIFTGALAYVAIHFSNFSGYDNEEAVYLNLNTKGQIDLIGIIIGGIMIGLLGVLYDVAIGQAVAVEELHKIAPHIERKNIFKRAIRMGREHIGALVDTLAIAYVGASLPLLLLFSISEISVSVIVNREMFATEILRILIGSIGLVLAVPITTLLSTVMLIKKQDANLNQETVKEEQKALESFKDKH